MKQLLYILSLYILCITVIPCHCGATGVGGCHEAHAGAVVTARDACHSAEGEASDLPCTPFCLCSGAHHPSLLPETQTPSVPTDTPYYIVTLTGYVAREGITMPADIWRPPQS